MTTGTSWSRPKEHGMPWGQDQTSNLVIGVSIASGIATAAHLPWKLGVAGIPTGCLLAHRPPAAAGMAARSGDNLCLPPAICFHLQASSRRTHMYTTQSQDYPSQGAVTGQANEFTRTVETQSQATEFWHERTTIKPGGYNIKSPCSNDLI